MRIPNRTLLAASCIALVAATACGGGVSAPTGPSGSSGATISGVVNGGHIGAPAASTAGAGLTAAAAPSGMTVAVVGTTLSASVDVLGQFQIAGIPSGPVELTFTQSALSASVRISSVGAEELVRIQVNVNGTTATIVNEVRSSGKVSLCHITGNGSYHLIEVSVNAEPAHRDHGDGAVGDPVPADTSKVFDGACVPGGAAVRIMKSTNNQDANSAPGPTIALGGAVTWQYLVTNSGNVPLTNVRVVDDRNVTVTCAGLTALAVGQSMTCTGSGVATAGQYKNIGTVTADWTGGTVKHSDASHYFGQAPDVPTDGPKVELCHRTGNGSYHLLEVSVSAEPAHRAHGDAKIGQAVPNSPGKVFGAGCAVQ